MLQIN